MESIKVLRSQETKEIMVGDRILVPLAGELGEFTATAHKITDRGVLFIFDSIVVNRPMNRRNDNKGGYDKSDLKRWIDSRLLEAFPAELRRRIEDLSIPTVGELFGNGAKWVNEHFEPDTDKQLPLMKEWRNRVAYPNKKWVWGWLRNATKENVSSFFFAAVDGYGNMADGRAAKYYGVRPEFWLVR